MCFCMSAASSSTCRCVLCTRITIFVQFRINRLALVMGTPSIFCEVGTEFLKYDLDELGRLESVLDMAIIMWNGRPTIRIYIFNQGKKFLSFPRRPAGLWCSPSLVLNKCGGKVAGARH